MASASPPPLRELRVLVEVHHEEGVEGRDVSGVSLPELHGRLPLVPCGDGVVVVGEDQARGLVDEGVQMSLGLAGLLGSMSVPVFGSMLHTNFSEGGNEIVTDFGGASAALPISKTTRNATKVKSSICGVAIAR